MDKSVLRVRLAEREAALTPKERYRSDSILCERFLEEHAVCTAGTILLYSSMGAEIDTRLILESLYRLGKRVLLPRCLPGHEMEARIYEPHRLKRHKYGMLEPDETCPIINKKEIELILVPALCYDRRRMRMGRGGGYYDRYLAQYAGMTVGLCRNALLCDQLPADPWDQPVGLVLTETERLEEICGPLPL